MKATDLETNSLHKVVSIDYDNNIVILQSKEYGRTRQTIDKVRLSLDANEDLKGKTIIHPKAFWMIPLVGWFMIPYTLFTTKNAVIISDTIKDQLIMSIAASSPIFILLGIICLTVYNA